jgi:hypothetical protein
MGKVIRLTESDIEKVVRITENNLVRIVKKVLC